MTWRPLIAASHTQDVAHFWRDTPDGGGEVLSMQDVGACLERNKVMAGANDGYSPSREFRRLGSVPKIIRDKWLNEEGWDAYRPDLYADKLAEKFNDPDWLWLRTAPGQVSAKGGVLR